jgi:uncharacterized YccA/Bax inhibitor family protein
MALNNPAFRNQAFQGNAATVATPTPTAETLQNMYDQPAASATETDRMTIEDSIVKTAITFGILFVGAAAAWVLSAGSPNTTLVIMIGAGIIGLVLGLVNVFKREPSAPLLLSYAAVEGMFVGAISSFFETQFPGVVVQAVLATFVVVGVTLALFASGKIRASKRATKIFLIAMIGYVIFSLINVVLMFTGVTNNAWGLRSAEIFGIPLGLILGVLVVIMAAYSLVLDFDFIQRGVRNRAARKYGWTGAFGITVTVIWLYLELLRMFAIARD